MYDRVLTIVVCRSISLTGLSASVNGWIGTKRYWRNPYDATSLGRRFPASQRYMTLSSSRFFDSGTVSERVLLGYNVPVCVCVCVCARAVPCISIEDISSVFKGVKQF